MPRPKKYRKVCHFPRVLSFHPEGAVQGKEPVILTVDEYETLRLIDRDGLSQEEASQRMHVARTTVQLIYASARKKLADVLVNGKYVAKGEVVVIEENFGIRITEIVK